MGVNDGQVLGTTRLLNHGPAGRRFNIVLLADGYREAEMGKWHADARAFADYLFEQPPFDALQTAVNIFRVDVTSVDSGADDPAACAGGTGATPRTFFDSTYCAGADRRIMSGDRNLVEQVLDEQVPDWDVALVIVNDTTWGGAAGGPICFFATAAGWPKVAVHELGHVGFGLADEYDYLKGCKPDGTAEDTDRNQYAGAEPGQPNVTANTDRATLKWGDLVDPATPLPTSSNADCTRCDRQANPRPAETVGAFDGAHTYHCGAFRPEWDCMMRNSGSRFCAVCRRHIWNAIAVWRGWHPIGDPAAGHVVPHRSPVWPVARGGRTDVFVVGHNGGIYTSGQDAPGAAWETWHPIGDPAAGHVVPQLTTATAAARPGERLDVFVVGNNRGIYTSGKTGAAGGGTWETWHPIGDPAAGHVVPHRSVVWPVARGDRLDVFVVGDNGGIYTSGQDAPGAAWETWHPIGDPAAGHTVPTGVGVPLTEGEPRTVVSAAHLGDERLEVFVVGHNMGIYTSAKTGARGSGSWEDWCPVGSPAAGETVPQFTTVGAASGATDRCGIFVVGHNEGIYTNELL